MCTVAIDWPIHSMAIGNVKWGNRLSNAYCGNRLLGNLTWWTRPMCARYKSLAPQSMQNPFWWNTYENEFTNTIENTAKKIHKTRALVYAEYLLASFFVLRAKKGPNVVYRQNSNSFLSYFSANLNVCFTDSDFEEKKKTKVSFWVNFTMW